MKLIHATENYAIYDDFFDKEVVNFIWTFIQEEQFSFSQQKEWERIFKLTDGVHLRGKVYLSRNAPELKNAILYPSNTILDKLCDTIDSHLDKFEKYIGCKDNDWLFYTLKAFIYPQGAGLPWHDDYTKSSGSFTYYCHPEWNIQWGGELLIADTSRKDAPLLLRERYNEGLKPIWPHIDNSKQNEIISDPGYGTYVLPKPNRMLIMKAGINHMIKKVDTAAGNRLRCSIQGFFHSPNKQETRY